MKTRFALAGIAIGILTCGAAFAADNPIPAKIGTVKPLRRAAVVSRSTAGFVLPTGPSQDPTVGGAQIVFFDTGGSGGSFLHTLPVSGWKALGPGGSKGFKYTGKRAGDALCRVVLVKPKVIKAVCAGMGLSLTTPFAGTDAIILGIPTVTGGAIRYCAELGGTTRKNDNTGLKRKDAPPPAMCPAFPPAATPTGTPAGTAAATATGTPAGTGAATVTPTNTPPAGSTATRTNTPPGVGSATPTKTPIASCPMAPGRYTTTTTGGTLRVSTFAPFAFPAGGKTLQDVSAGDANCVHTTVVPYPGGLTVPVFCVPALGATTSVTQSGCGVGRIDSNGGSDFTISERGDTSEAPVCNVAQLSCPSTGPAPDSSGRIEVKVGDGTVDTCSSGGTGNAIVTIPVNTLTWVAADSSCPDNDGTYNAGSDTKLAEFPQTLDLTTDTNTAQFADLDANGCAKSGLGPTGPFSSTGQCINFTNNTINIAASGTVFSSGGPTYDLLFTTLQNNTQSGPAPSGGATCPSPPVLNFAGTANRCLVGP